MCSTRLPAPCRGTGGGSGGGAATSEWSGLHWPALPHSICLVPACRCRRPARLAWAWFSSMFGSGVAYGQLGGASLYVQNSHGWAGVGEFDQSQRSGSQLPANSAPRWRLLGAIRMDISLCSGPGSFQSIAIDMHTCASARCLPSAAASCVQRQQRLPLVSAGCSLLPLALVCRGCPVDTALGQQPFRLAAPPPLPPTTVHLLLTHSAHLTPVLLLQRHGARGASLRVNSYAEFEPEIDGPGVDALLEKDRPK